MTIDEATELQAELLKLLPEVGFNKYLASTWLGVEALKRIRKSRGEAPRYYIGYLPEETGEEESKIRGLKQ